MSGRRGSSRGGGSRGGGYGDKRRDQVRVKSRPQEDAKPPIILAKPDRPVTKEPSQPRDQEYELRNPKPSEVRQLLARRDSLHREDTESPKPEQPTKAVVAPVKISSGSNIPSRNVKLVDDQQFCEPLADFMTDNQDFLTIGALGTQSAGKSFLLNAIVKIWSGVPAKEEENKSDVNGYGSQRTFRVQTFEKQMLSEHCTNGINAWVNADGVIFLDAQPIFSNSVLDRTVHLEKKFSFEFNGAENTVDVHSMQEIGYLMSICNVVLIVQEGSNCDVDLIEKLKTSDLLKPSFPAPASFEEPNALIEYSPEVIFVHNKVQTTEMNSQTLTNLRQIYADNLDGSPLNFRYRSGLSADTRDKKQINLFLIPDVESSLDLDYEGNFDPTVTFNSSILLLRQALSRVQPRPFSSNLKQTEKIWFSHAQKAWEQIKSSSFYLEYSRLMRLH